MQAQQALTSHLRLLIRDCPHYQRDRAAGLGAAAHRSRRGADGHRQRAVRRPRLRYQALQRGRGVHAICGVPARAPQRLRGVLTRPDSVNAQPTERQACLLQRGSTAARRAAQRPLVAPAAAASRSGTACPRAGPRGTCGQGWSTEERRACVAAAAALSLGSMHGTAMHARWQPPSSHAQHSEEKSKDEEGREEGKTGKRRRRREDGNRVEEMEVPAQPPTLGSRRTPGCGAGRQRWSPPAWTGSRPA